MLRPTATNGSVHIPKCLLRKNLRNCKGRPIAAVSRGAWLALAAVAVFPFVGCSTDTSDRDLEFIDAARAIELHARDQGRAQATTLFVDPRPVAQFQSQRIPGAVHLPIGQATGAAQRLAPIDGPAANQPRALSEFSNVVVYGTDPASASAPGLAKRLMGLGLRDVAVLRGGLLSWRTRGGPIAGDAVPAPAEASPAPTTP